MVHSAQKVIPTEKLAADNLAEQHPSGNVTCNMRATGAIPLSPPPYTAHLKAIPSFAFASSTLLGGLQLSQQTYSFVTLRLSPLLHATLTRTFPESRQVSHDIGYRDERSHDAILSHRHVIDSDPTSLYRPAYTRSQKPAGIVTPQSLPPKKLSWHNTCPGHPPPLLRVDFKPPRCRRRREGNGETRYHTATSNYGNDNGHAATAVMLATAMVAGGSGGNGSGGDKGRGGV
ncbi:hypothetical protein EDB84DRAFT_1571161 [Lactarius hengduanensis]|nr:hypothetical protein EDB84DRAFT_1571161 [Lactarius hengduanensis]